MLAWSCVVIRNSVISLSLWRGSLVVTFCEEGEEMPNVTLASAMLGLFTKISMSVAANGNRHRRVYINGSPSFSKSSMLSSASCHFVDTDG